MKTCSKCRVEKSIDDFHRQGKKGRHSYCRSCFNARPKASASSESRRKWNLQRRYGITPERMDAMLLAQGGCGICGVDQTPIWMVDHDHKTGAVRGVLCRRCNILLAGLDDEEFRTAGMRYLGLS